MNWEAITQPDEPDEPEEIILMDEEDARRHVYREAAIRAKQYFDRVFAFIAAYDGSKSFAFDCACLGMGQGDLISCHSHVELGERYHKTKAAVTKCVKQFQDLTGTPPMPGQRSEAAREKFSRVRKGQLRPAKPAKGKTK